jgi:hypothetical protein
MIRPTTSLTRLAATAATALFVITLSAEATFGATTVSDKTPSTSVSDAKVIPGPTPLAAVPETDAAAVTPNSLELNYTPVAPAVGVEPDAAGRRPHRRGYCRCSCGSPCSTDADCGGSSCDPFITCC